MIAAARGPMRAAVATSAANPGPTSADLIKSAARALDLLELFARRRIPLSAGELGLALGYPRSSLNVLLKSLVAQGYLAHDPAAATYFPTLRVTTLGDWLPDVQLLAAAEPIMAQLRDDTRETITLTVLSGGSMRVMKALIGPEPIALRLQEGTAFPVAGTAIGAAALATLSPADAGQIATRVAGRDAVTELLAAAATARQHGHAVAYDAVLPDTGAIARGLRAGVGSVFVLAIAGLSSRMRRSEARFARLLEQATSGLES